MLYRNFRPLESPLYHINFTSRVKNSRIADSHSSTRNYEYQEYHKTVENVGRKRLLSEYRRGNLSLHESFCILRFEENAFSVSSGLASVFEILAVKLTPITYTGRERPWHFQLWIFCCLTYFFLLTIRSSSCNSKLFILVSNGFPLFLLPSISYERQILLTPFPHYLYKLPCCSHVPFILHAEFFCRTTFYTFLSNFFCHRMICIT